jgi:hypothetical protein
MKYFNQKMVLFLVSFIICIFGGAMISSSMNAIPSNNAFFKVRILCRSDDHTKSIINILAQDLMTIRIESYLTPQTQGAFESFLASGQYDLVFVELNWFTKDIDPRIYFSEKGAGNYWGLDSTQPGVPLNEELLDQGVISTLETNRYNNYSEWQLNLLENILPVYPIYNKITSYLSWLELEGWDHQKGIIASLPDMEWTAPHKGQDNVSVFNDYMNFWPITLNPLFYEDDFVSSLFAEPLIRYDYNLEPTGVLAKNWSYNENKTILRLNLRENVYWQEDVDGLYQNESFTVDDVVFSINMYKELSTWGTFFNWIDHYEIIDDYTIDLFIDGNENLPENQPFAPALPSLTKLIIPEHYLNVSVDSSGIPDTSHDNWVIYGEEGLGTGMYYLKEYNEGVQGSFSVNPNWWGSTPSGYNKNLSILQYNIRILNDIQAKRLEFQTGDLDVFHDYQLSYDNDYDQALYQKQSRTSNIVGFIGFNIQSIATPEMGDPVLCEGANISKGLAIRKAMAYLFDKSKIIDLLDIEAQVTHTPFPKLFDDYKDENIQYYKNDLDIAKDYIYLAGFDPSTFKSSSFQYWMFLWTILFMFIVRKGFSNYQNKK